jgi:hypothetical protein
VDALEWGGWFGGWWIYHCSPTSLMGCGGSWSKIARDILVDGLFTESQSLVDDGGYLNLVMVEARLPVCLYVT